MAQLYRDGIGVERDTDASIYWFKKAIELKITWCKPELFDVLKLKSNEYQKEMFAVASSGANDGYVKSTIQLSYCYRNGIGTEIDAEKSKMLINSALQMDFVPLYEIPFLQCSKKLLIKELVAQGLILIRKEGIGATITRMKRFFIKKSKVKIGLL